MKARKGEKMKIVQTQNKKDTQAEDILYFSSCGAMNPVSFLRFLFLYSWVSFLFLRVSVSGSAATIFPSAQKAARTRLQNTCNPRHEKFRPDRLRG